jgi:ATP-dependent DNA helicase RecQ
MARCSAGIRCGLDCAVRLVQSRRRGRGQALSDGDAAAPAGREAGCKPIMSFLRDALRQHFEHDAFRRGQEALVCAVIEGRDLLAVMPTGSGKSLGYQLPAVVLPGTTIVVSPLISLMKDQVDDLDRRGIAAAALHSMLGTEEWRDAWRRARDGTLRLLYAAPERFRSDAFLDLLRAMPVARFVVDEAHCVSEWGHDFRPDYRRLRAAALACRRADGQVGRPPLAAFTATATPEVREDIVDLLGLATPTIIVSGFDRPNIELRVRPVAGDWEKRELLPQMIGSGRALVYASTRKGVEQAAETLGAAGVGAEAYHAGLDDAERVRVQDAFAAGRARVVCATNAFGMGIDRPDVDTVVHVDVPGSIEAYYQEIGRGGRDGRPAIATLLWNYADVKTREFLIDKSREDGERQVDAPVVDPEEVARRKALEHTKLKRMVAYATTGACLRATILRYFGDPAAKEPCGACSNCHRRVVLGSREIDLVRTILSGIARCGERFGRRRVAAMLVGAVDDLPAALRRLPTTGLLSGERAQDIEQWIDAARGAGLAAESPDQYRTLSLTTFGRQVMAGHVRELEMSPPVRATARAARQHPPRPGRAARPRGRPSGQPVRPRDLDVDGAADRLVPGRAGAARDQGAEKRGDAGDAALERALRSWRLGLARQLGLPPYVILHDTTLAAIVGARPRTPDELLNVQGVGPVKAKRYGSAILALMTHNR